MGSRPSSFADAAAALDDLPAALRIMRRSRRLSLREAASECGVAFNTLSRLERGGDCSLESAKAVLCWLDSPASWRNAEPDETPGQVEPDDARPQPQVLGFDPPDDDHTGECLRRSP